MSISVTDFMYTLFKKARSDVTFMYLIIQSTGPQQNY